MRKMSETKKWGVLGKRDYEMTQAEGKGNILFVTAKIDLGLVFVGDCRLV